MSGEFERFDPAEHRGRILYEHLHRYAVGSDFASGKRILDIACGSGYGTNILAETAAETIGVDIDAASIRQAKRKFKRSNLKFVAADCYDMPFEAETFDLAVANEMIEHVHEHDALIEEVKRVLRPGGTFLVSTPNKPVYNRYKTPNKYHVAELELSEFRLLLKRHFKHVRLFGQRMALLSAGFALDESRPSNLASAKLYCGDLSEAAAPHIKNEELSLEDPEYLIAYCSDEPISDLPIMSTIFFSPDDDLWLEHEKIMAWASQLHEEDEQLRQDLSRSRLEVSAHQENLARLEGERVDLVRERDEALSRSAAVRSEILETPARLLSRLTGAPVGADEASLIESLFAVNEQLISNRLRLHEADAAIRQANDLRTELAVYRRTAERRVSELQAARELSRSELEQALGRLQAADQSLETLHSEIRTTRQAADQQVRALEAARETARSELDQTKERLRDAEQSLETLQAALADSQSQREEFAGQLNHRATQIGSLEIAVRQSEVELAEAREEIARQSAEIAKLREEEARLRRKDRASAMAATPATTAAVGDEQSSPTTLGEDRAKSAAAQSSASLRRRRDRLSTAQREAQQQLEIARADLRDRLIPEAPSKHRGRLSKLLHPRRSRFQTVVFQKSWVERQYGISTATLADFVRRPEYFRLDPHPLFAAQWYLELNPDVASSGKSPLLHYLRHGWREGRDPHPYFCNDYYLARNPDVLESGLNPLEHYLIHGWQEGRWPNPVFDPTAYLERYPDVRDSGMEPLTHYIIHGIEEEREIPFRNHRDWRNLVSGASRSASLIDYLLHEPVGKPSEDQSEDESRASPGNWPPPAINDFWLPQRMRDYLIERHGEETIALYQYLYSLMDAFAEDAERFAHSGECSRLMRRLRELSARRAVNAAQRPDVSIIIPVYNNIVDTMLAIASILEVETSFTYEIVVADDSSTDATPDLIPGIGGVVRHLRQSQNYGFLGNCNAAAEKALGRTIVLLNNDTLVLPNWLDGLLDPIRRDERIGLVGSKLICWDGKLQEAGGIFWSDGSAWNFGRGDDALAPQYNYLKDVDYCSGASIAIPTELWRSLGGFDPAFSPAYCEDSDLAFRIRAAGYRTVYSPLSEVIHHEGRSHGRDLSSGIKSYQVANQARLVERWWEVLNEEHYPNGQNVLRARDRTNRKPHILVVDHYIPQFDKDAGSKTMSRFLEALVASGWAVTFWPENLHRDPDYLQTYQNLGIEVIYGPQFAGKFADFLRDRADLYDAALLSRPHVSANFIDDIRAITNARVLYYGHDIHFERMKAQLQYHEGSIDPDAIEDMKSMELSVCERSDVVLYPSDYEARHIASFLNPEIRSLAVPAYSFSNEEIAAGDRAARSVRVRDGRPARLLFVGGFSHTPNVDGIIWFCNEVLPVLRGSDFKFQLSIAGSNPSAAIWDLRSEDTHVLGFVSDEELRALYRDSSIVVAPLRFGAGVKGKVIEAMAFGVPVVTTTVGVQGIENADETLFVAETVDEWRQALQSATNPEVARAKAVAAVDYVRNHYSQSAMMHVLREALPSVGSNAEAA